MVDSLFNAMATAAFFEFVIFAVFEMRYMLNIWKSRQGNLLDSRAQQRQLLRLYAKFYLALLCSIVITYQAQRCASFSADSHLKTRESARHLI